MFISPIDLPKKIKICIERDDKLYIEISKIRWKMNSSCSVSRVKGLFAVELRDHILSENS